MIDFAQFSAWVVVALFFVTVGLVLSRTPDRHDALVERWERFSLWLSAHAEHEIDEDEQLERAELRLVLREERVRADLERLRHLIATDTYMSATRQIGNRIAYQQVLVEARTITALPAPVPYRAWTREFTDRSPVRHSSAPESLDISWR